MKAEMFKVYVHAVSFLLLVMPDVLSAGARDPRCGSVGGWSEPLRMLGVCTAGSSIEWLRLPWRVPFDSPLNTPILTWMVSDVFCSLSGMVLLFLGGSAGGYREPIVVGITTQMSETREIWSAIKRISTEVKSLIMKSRPVLDTYNYHLT